MDEILRTTENAIAVPAASNQGIAASSIHPVELVTQ
jgi:hypothetical protein